MLWQVVGGWVAEKFSAKHVFGLGALLNIVCTLFVPLAAERSYVVVLALRVVMGIGGVSGEGMGGVGGRGVGWGEWGEVERTERSGVCMM